jgi:hypothetical protein
VGQVDQVNDDEVRLSSPSCVQSLHRHCQMDIGEDDACDSDNGGDENGHRSVPPDDRIPRAGEWFVERAKFIPLRLTIPERKCLRLLDAALQVSEYTDKIDTYGFGLSKTKRIVHQIRELCQILSGLVLSVDYKQGQELFSDRDFRANAAFYQKIFELGRRHKIMNPDKMRTTYGKLIYLLQVRLSCPLPFFVDANSVFRTASHLKFRTSLIFRVYALSKRCTAFWNRTMRSSSSETSL